MRKLTVLFALLASGALLAHPGRVASSQSNPDLDFPAFLEGVKYASISLTPDEQKQVDTQGSLYYFSLRDFLYKMGFEKVALQSEEREEMDGMMSSLCKRVTVKATSTSILDNTSLGNHELTFTSCNDDTFSFASDEAIAFDDKILQSLDALWASMCPANKKRYNPRYQLRLKTLELGKTKQELRGEFERMGEPRSLEGIYEVSIAGKKGGKGNLEIGIILSNKKAHKGMIYNAYYLSGASCPDDWVEGEKIGHIVSLATDNYYKVMWHLPNKKIDYEAQIYQKPDKSIVLTTNLPEYEETEFLRTEPSFDPDAQQEVAYRSSGTGVAISSNGYILTSEHVIKGGGEILVNVKGQMHRASIVLQDPTFDLAVLKVEANFGTLPYGLSNDMAKEGEEVFTIGFPLTATMGFTPKLTNGIISSLKGYEDDPNAYQVSVPVQPGNSGGPLFDHDGNLVGIIKAKHAQADIATYAVKAYRLNEILRYLHSNGVYIPPQSPKTNQGKTLNDHYNTLRNFTFLIKVD